MEKPRKVVIEEATSIPESIKLVRVYVLNPGLGARLALQINDELAAKVKRAEEIVRGLWQGIEVRKLHLGDTPSSDQIQELQQLVTELDKQNENLRQI